MVPSVRRVPLWVGAAGVMALGGVFIALWFWGQDIGWIEDIDPPEELVAKSFDGSSEGLRQTVIVPTLDTPIPEGKSAVWCLSFQLAWNQFEKDVTRGPARIRNADEVVARLHGAKESDADLAPGTYYAAAGLVRDGIVERIQQEMAQRFPDAQQPDLAAPPVAVAYAYLKGGVRYRHKFFDNTERFRFTDSSGKSVALRSFGISDRERYKDGHRDSFRGQVEILWRDGDAFAVDLSKESAPNQIVLARVPRQSTLAEMVAGLWAKLRTERRPDLHLGEEDTLLVPVMHWRVEHHFRELEGPDKVLVHPSLHGIYLATALQVTEFKLDRHGAEVASEAIMAWANGGPQRYHFDRPFLICMKKRDAEHPFFVMWVDNAELLCRW